MRYRAEVYIDIWANSKEEAEEQMEDQVLKIPNAFIEAVSRMPHGSKISIVQEDQPDAPA